MSTPFEHILVPIDFTTITEVAVKKAVELSNPTYTTLHLFYVKTSTAFVKSINTLYKEQSEEILIKESEESQLNQWKLFIEEIVPEIKIATDILCYEHIEQAIINKAIEINADLIVLGKQHKHSWFTFSNSVSPNKLAQHTNSAVLTIKPGALHHKIKTVVIPVCSSNTQQKLNLISVIAQKFKLRIHLVSVISGRNNENLYSSALIESFRFLKDVLHCSVEYQVLHEDNKAKAVLKYAQSIDADMVLVNAVMETKVSAILNRHISDLVAPDSGLHILSVRANS